MTKRARFSDERMMNQGMTYTCDYEWPEDCFCQCGSNGIVLERGTFEKAFTDPETTAKVLVTGMTGEDTGLKVRRTAFFEAFPHNPNTYIRGEGETVKEAEAETWKLYQKYLQCPGHEFEARNYENGGGFCKHCGMFGSDVIPPRYTCKICGAQCWGTKDIQGNHYCEKHTWDIPDELATDSHLFFKKMMQDAKEFNKRFAAKEDTPSED